MKTYAFRIIPADGGLPLYHQTASFRHHVQALRRIRSLYALDLVSRFDGCACYVARRVIPTPQAALWRR